jgi:hypothetical protein
MRPIPFEESNVTFAKDQPEYLPLPAHLTGAGEVITCWELTWLERIKLLFSGKIWLRVLTFGKPLQPQLPEIENPFVAQQATGG